MNPVGISAIHFALGTKKITKTDLIQTENDAHTVKNLGITAKTAPHMAEDTVTLAIRAAFPLLKNKTEIDALIFASETHMYAVNPTSTLLATWLGLKKQIQAIDVEFACKSGTTALLLGLMGTRKDYQNALIVAADVATGKTGDALAFTAGTGAVSVRVSVDSNQIIAQLQDHTSFATHKTDFWRPHGENSPRHGGRFSNTSYFQAITQNLDHFFAKTNTKPADFNHIVVHQPNGKLPLQIYKHFGFTSAQYTAGFVFPHTGNCYSAQTLLGLNNILAQAKPNQNILVASYGSGAGSDVIWLKTTKNIEKNRPKAVFSPESQA